MIFNIVIFLAFTNCLFASQERIDFLIQHIDNSLKNAEQGNTKLPNEVFAIKGMSGKKGRIFLNEICSLDQANYLEIGIHRGSTFIAALYGNKNISSAYAIDNWSQGGHVGDEFRNNCNRFLLGYPINFFEQECFQFNLSKISNKISVYFYDGDHTVEAQTKAFTYYNDVFDDIFIAIVDDWIVDPRPSEGTRQAFKLLNYTVLYEKVMYDGPSNPNGWWNGCYVVLLRK